MHRPAVASIDGIQLDRLVVGRMYSVSDLLGAVLITEGWAQLVRGEPAGVLPFSNLGRLMLPPPPMTTADKPRRPRFRKKN